MPPVTQLAARIALALATLAAAHSMALAAEPTPGADDADAAQVLDSADSAGEDAASDAELCAMLAKDGKLVKRPVLVHDGRVLVGFDEAAYAALFA